jgi:predicted DNA-binding transcriptional regulator AlpA
MKYENLKKFIISTKASKSTIYRFYKKNENLFQETTIPNGRRLFPIDHVRYFDSEIMFNENKILRQENQSMRNLKDCLADKTSFQHTFWEMEWSFFFTVAYKLERNKNSCFKKMHGLYDYLNEKHGASTELRLFFTTESFNNRKGYHNHFVIYIEDKRLHKQVVTDIQDYFNYDRTDVSIYDKYKAGLFYMSKDGLSGEDWDFINNTTSITSNENYA